MLVKVERLASDLSKVRLYHTSVARAIASWPGWPGESGFRGSFEDYVAEEFPTSQAADFAVLEAGIVSEETYVEQGLHWSTADHPLLEYVLDEYEPDLAFIGAPTTDESQHQFLGLVTRRLPNGASNPALDGRPPEPWEGPIIAITEALQSTTLDLVVAGHTHRPANTVVGRIPVVEGFNVAASYSVAQLTIARADVAWAGTATRTAKNTACRRAQTCRRSSTRPTPRPRSSATR
jgi:hypothetical protein